GTVELENTLTLDYRQPGDHNFKQAAMENELEWQPLEKLALRLKGAYFYEDSAEHTGLRFDEAGFETQYYFTNPNTDLVGISVIGSILSGDNSIDSENFLVIQKDFEKWIVAYNFGVTIEVDNSYGHHTGGRDTTVALVNQAGIEYQFTRTI